MTLQEEYNQQTEALREKLMAGCPVKVGDRIRYENLWHRMLDEHPVREATVINVVAEVDIETLVMGNGDQYTVGGSGEVRLYFDDGTDEILRELKIHDVKYKV